MIFALPPRIPNLVILFFPLPRNSSRNTNEQTLVDVRVFSVNPNLASPSVSPTSLTKNPSSSTVVDAKTFIPLNPL